MSGIASLLMCQTCIYIDNQEHKIKVKETTNINKCYNPKRTQFSEAYFAIRDSITTLTFSARGSALYMSS